jgi:vanillate O-demethylase monooxygenase subunit
MAFIRNSWYVAAWAEELSDQLLSRQILGEHIVFYRSEAGKAIALADTCPHRFAPLSLGKKVGGSRIQCPYHGLQFDENGRCVHVPDPKSKIPVAAKVKTYAVVERDRLIWVWGGSIERADPAAIPDFSFLNITDGREHTAGRLLTMPLKSDLILDNLLDLSHLAFLHPDNLGNDGVAEGTMEVQENKGSLLIKNSYPSGPPSPVFVATGAAKADDIVEFWIDERFDAPGALFIDSGVAPVGWPRSDGHMFSSSQFLTPETVDSTHYFWQVSRDYGLHDAALTLVIEASVNRAFTQQDEPMVAACQRRMQGRAFWDMKPVLLPNDVGAIRARRMMDKLTAAETGGESRQGVEPNQGTESKLGAKSKDRPEGEPGRPAAAASR